VPLNVDIGRMCGVAPSMQTSAQTDLPILDPLNKLSEMLLLSDESRPKLFDLVAVVECLAMAHEEPSTTPDCKYHSAQNHQHESGTHPQMSSNDCRCMAMLVKVNGLKA
jgi:hypothetical protein